MRQEKKLYREERALEKWKKFQGRYQCKVLFFFPHKTIKDYKSTAALVEDIRSLVKKSISSQKESIFI